MAADKSFEMIWKLTSEVCVEYDLVFKATNGVEKIEFWVWIFFHATYGVVAGIWMQEKGENTNIKVTRSRQKFESFQIGEIRHYLAPALLNQSSDRWR